MTAFTSSIQAIDVIVRDQASKAIAERAVVDRIAGKGDLFLWVASDPDSDPEFGLLGFGLTREAAIADLIENSDIDTSPDPTPEQRAAWRAAEDDWIPPGGWDDGDDLPDDEQLCWETETGMEGRR